MSRALAPADAILDPARRRSVWDGPIVDADVHAVVPSLRALEPYLARQWVEFIHERQVPEPWGLAVAYPPAAPTTARPEWRPTDGRPAGSGLDLLGAHVLDALDVELAILTCSYAVDSIRHPDFAAALASAVNDWLIAEWLEPEPRLRGSLVLPPRHPAQMLAELDRVGGHPGFVQALFPVRSDRPWGNRLWHPVLAALAERDLVLGLHWGGTSDGPPTPTGWPSWFVEEYAGEQQVYMAQLTSLIGEGAFQAVPSLRVAVGEIGFAWLPSLLWRLQKEWKGLRRDIPWVRQPPAELVREHVRFTTAPLDAPAHGSDDLAEIVDWLGSEDLLLYASDYPHGHELSVERLLAASPATMRPRLMSEAARAFYRLPGRRG